MFGKELLLLLRKNIGMRFVCFVGHDVEPDMDKVITKDEVQEIKWLEIGELKSPEKIYIYSDKINPTEMKWAFGHNKLIPEVIAKYYKIYQKNLVD